jgi:hypothetical protein
VNAKIPVASTDLSGHEERYAVDAIRSSWISSTGPYLSRFEAEFAALCGVKSALAVSNGTVALHLALLGLDVRPGDEVIVPSLTYVATANAVRYVGGEPVFVDVDPETWCLDPRRLEEAITRRTRGIIAVHLVGHPADMDRINHLAVVNGLWVVEDAAEAHLASYKGRPVGGLARLATFSFFGNKLFTCGEGGAITLSDDQLNTRLRILRGQGMDPQRRYYFPVTCYNSPWSGLLPAGTPPAADAVREAGSGGAVMVGSRRVQQADRAIQSHLWQECLATGTPRTAARQDTASGPAAVLLGGPCRMAGIRCLTANPLLQAGRAGAPAAGLRATYSPRPHLHRPNSACPPAPPSAWRLAAPGCRPATARLRPGAKWGSPQRSRPCQTGLLRGGALPCFRHGARLE